MGRRKRPPGLAVAMGEFSHVWGSGCAPDPTPALGSGHQVQSSGSAAVVAESGLCHSYPEVLGGLRGRRAFQNRAASPAWRGTVVKPPRKHACYPKR